MFRNATRAVGALAAAAAAVALAATPALADPSGYRSLTGTGSDTTQYVMGGLADVIGGGTVIGSYDAIGSTTIQTRSGGPTFARPNGSGNGVRALTASINPTGGYTYSNGSGGQVAINGQLDFARSSSGPSAAGTDLTYIPFARDAVSYAYSNWGTASAPSYLTVAELAAIYRGTLTTFRSADGVTREYLPRLPQTGSGTRQFFLQQIGVSEAEVHWITGLVQENDGSEIDSIGEIVPFSVASWVAQNNNVVPNTVVDNDVVLGAIDDDYWGVVAPVWHGKLNSVFPINRLVYNVVQTSRLSGTSPADLLLQQTFAGSGSSVCQNASVINQYGFGTIANCGNTTTYKSGYVAP
ncbi:MAG: hypothetical protein LBK95_13385 [Bifidobacteriaceae bacterium]|jgi:hypothetical protein|nr:hypothetical protein [Bifidobacteriaceae bacterium]